MYETNEQTWLWKDLSGNNNNGTIYNGSWNDENGLYLPTPYNSYVDIYYPTFEVEDEETVEIEFSTNSYGNEVLYQGYTKEKIGIFMINSKMITCVLRLCGSAIGCQPRPTEEPRVQDQTTASCRCE
jgi:hypothetical protein